MNWWTIFIVGFLIWTIGGILLCARAYLYNKAYNGYND